MRADRNGRMYVNKLIYKPLLLVRPCGSPGNEIDDSREIKQASLKIHAGT